MTPTALMDTSGLEELLSAAGARMSAAIGRGYASVVPIDPATGYPDLAALRTPHLAGPIRLCALDFEQHCDVFRRLAQGEAVTIDEHLDWGLPPEENGAGGDRTVLLLPIIHEGSLEAFACLVVPRGRGATPATVTALRELCAQTAPPLARMRELETLRKRNAETVALLEGCGAPERVAGLIQAKNELEAIVEIKSHLISNLAHEFRTPLVAVRGYTRMLLEERAGNINPTQREYLSTVADNATRLVNLLNNLLHYTASRELRPQALDLRSLGLAALQRIRPLAVEKGIRIKVHISPEEFMIVGDKVKLAQVFDDLLSNALKFTNRGGEIAVDFARQGGDEVTVKVSDTGVTIPPGLLDKIAGRRARAEQRPDGGAGEGTATHLSSVHDIIRLHGGRISVTAKVGEGTSFVFTLPALRAQADQEAIPVHDQASSSSSGR